MKFILAYYSQFAQSDGVDEGGKESVAVDKDNNRVSVDFDKVEEYAKKNKPGGDVSLFLREAEAFNGVVEVHNDSLPVAVVLLGDGPAMDRVREAYESLEVEVQDGSLDDEGDVSRLAEAGDDVDEFNGDIVALKAKAHEIGLTFSPTIGYKNLLSRVQAMLREKEEAQNQS